MGEGVAKVISGAGYNPMMSSSFPLFSFRLSKTEHIQIIPRPRLTESKLAFSVEMILDAGIV